MRKNERKKAITKENRHESFFLHMGGFGPAGGAAWQFFLLCGTLRRSSYLALFQDDPRAFWLCAIKARLLPRLVPGHAHPAKPLCLRFVLEDGVSFRRMTRNTTLAFHTSCCCVRCGGRRRTRQATPTAPRPCQGPSRAGRARAGCIQDLDKGLRVEAFEFEPDQDRYLHQPTHTSKLLHSFSPPATTTNQSLVHTANTHTRTDHNHIIEGLRPVTSPPSHPRNRSHVRLPRANVCPFRGT